MWKIFRGSFQRNSRGSVVKELQNQGSVASVLRLTRWATCTSCLPVRDIPAQHNKHTEYVQSKTHHPILLLCSLSITQSYCCVLSPSHNLTAVFSLHHTILLLCSLSIKHTKQSYCCVLSPSNTPHNLTAVFSLHQTHHTILLLCSLSITQSYCCVLSPSNTPHNLTAVFSLHQTHHTILLLCFLSITQSYCCVLSPSP